MDPLISIVRKVTSADLKQVTAIVHSNPTMYGANISEYHSYIINRFMSQPKDELPATAWCVEHDGQLIGLAIQYWWTILPIWSVASLFFRNTVGVNQYNAVKIGAVLVNGMTQYAEKKGINDFCYVVRDTGTLRKDRSLALNEELNTRYSIIDLLTLPPGQKPTHLALSNMMGMVNGRHTKPVVFRMAHLKNEFRALAL